MSPRANRPRYRLRAMAAILTLAGLSACMAHTAPKVAPEGIGFRQARTTQVTAMRAYRQCRDDAVALDRQARQEASPARYLASARLLEKCEAELGSDANQIAREERMRAYGLSVQNYLKAGDLGRASANLDRLKKAFPGADLYYADGSSFIETMEVLLSRERREAVGEYALLNVNRDLKDELRRVRYWQRN